jgi:hypothetical protein
LGADEDFWAAPFPQAGSLPARLFADDDVFLPAGAPAIQDEDYWAVSLAWPIAPAPIIFRDEDIIVPQPVPFWTDEDFWVNPVAPVQAQNFLLLPYLPDRRSPAFGILPGPFVGLSLIHTYPQLQGKFRTYGALDAASIRIIAS